MSIFDKIFGGRTKESCTENYLVYCILGKVQYEREKLQYAAQWMKCFEILDNFLSDCETKTVSSEQVFRKVLAYGKDGYPRVSYKNAATGGLLKWNEKNNKKICETHLNTFLLDIEKAEKSNESYTDWLEKQFPKRDTDIEFRGHQVLARIEKTDNLNRNQHNDFIFRISHSVGISLGWPANQALDILICERYVKQKGQEKIEKLITQIGELAHAIKIGKTEMPAALYEKNKQANGGEIMRSLIWRNYGLSKELNFVSNPAGKEWAVILEKR